MGSKFNTMRKIGAVLLDAAVEVTFIKEVYDTTFDQSYTPVRYSYPRNKNRSYKNKAIAFNYTPNTDTDD